MRRNENPRSGFNIQNLPKIIKVFITFYWALYCCLTPLIVTILPISLMLLYDNGYYGFLFLITFPIGYLLADKMWFTPSYINKYLLI